MKRLAVLLALVALACDPPFSAPVYVTALRVTPDSANLETGGNVQLTAVATDSAGRTLSGVRVIWTSSVDSIASVSPTGLVHCVRPGYVTISAAAQGASGKAALTITVRVTAVRIDQPAAALVPGGAFPFSAHALDSVGDFLFRPITWATSDASVLTVSTGGVVAAHAPGSAFIQVSIGALRDSVAVTVRPVRFVQIKTGEWDHTCGLTADSVTYCWGRNDLEQLGISSGGASVPAPVSASTTPTFGMLAVGATFTCGGQPAGVIYCWGSSAGGRLGGGVTTVTHAVPKPVFGTGGLLDPSASWAHACALASGVPVCWGRNPAAGGAGGVNWIPMVVAKGVNYLRIAAGASFTCAIDTDSAAFCWGQNVSGELGNGTVGEDSPAPTAVAGGLSFAQLTGGWYHACGLTGAGAAWCWGSNASGELGTGDTASIESTPVAVAGGLAFTSISAGGGRTCALATSGVVYCWGNAISPTPTPAGGSLTFSSITVGEETICAIGTDAVAYCWGDNVGGEVGDGTVAPRAAPTRVLGQP
jgi:hypothetical protein